MEQHIHFKEVISKISYLNRSLEYLTQDINVDKIQSDTIKDIEEHFEGLIKAIQERKQNVIQDAVNLSLEIKQQIDAEKKDLQNKIDITNKILESGASIYPLQPDVASSIWESSKKVIHKNKLKELKVELPSLETIHSHGKVRISHPLLEDTSVYTLAGFVQGNKDGIRNKAQMNGPWDVVLNPVDDCLYVSDCFNNSIRKITKRGSVSTFANCYRPSGITFFQKEKCFFVVEYGNHSIKRISLEGETTSFAGCGKGGYKDGEGEKAMFYYPSGIAVNDNTGDLYVTDTGNNVIRKITSQGTVSTLAGNPNKSLFNSPLGICFHPHQALLVCDNRNDRLLKVSLSGEVSSIVKIHHPESVCVVHDNIFLCASSTHKIHKVTIQENGEHEVELAGERGNYNEPTEDRRFSSLRGLAIDSKTDTCFVADFNSSRILGVKIIRGLAIDSKTDTCFVADFNSSRILGVKIR